jgi:RNA polymerase sigma-70 factor (ECF subfamily)
MDRSRVIPVAADQMDTPPTAAHPARALFQEHGAAVYRFAAVLLHHHHDAEDVVQETFLKLLHHLRDGGRAENLRGWIFTVAAHAARDRQRRRSRWVPWAARDRLLLALRAQGLSYRDIAAASGIRLSSVGRLLARAVDRWQRARELSERAQKGMDLYEMSQRRPDSGPRR